MNPHNQSMVIHQQFSILAQELQNFTSKVSIDLLKVTQACLTVHVSKSRLVQDDFLQALAKPRTVHLQTLNCTENAETST